MNKMSINQNEAETKGNMIFKIKKSKSKSSFILGLREKGQFQDYVLKSSQVSQIFVPSKIIITLKHYKKFNNEIHIFNTIIN